MSFREPGESATWKTWVNKRPVGALPPSKPPTGPALPRAADLRPRDASALAPIPGLVLSLLPVHVQGRDPLDAASALTLMTSGVMILTGWRRCQRATA